MEYINNQEIFNIKLAAEVLLETLKYESKIKVYKEKSEIDNGE